MAGDWIKMRTDLYRDPKVCVIADLLMSNDSALARYVNQQMQCDMSVTRNVTRNVTVGALVSVWGIFRRRGKRIGDDLVVYNCSPEVIDDIADIPGFGGAMEEVGWVVETTEGITLPNFFEEFNVDPTDEKREKDAARQRKYRSSKGSATSSVTVTPKCHAREEKRREEYKEPLKPPPGHGRKLELTVEIPEVLRGESFLSAWADWLSHRKENGWKTGPTCIRNALARLEHLGTERATEAVRHSIAQGWRGIFEDHATKAPPRKEPGLKPFKVPAPEAATHG